MVQVVLVLVLVVLAVLIALAVLLVVVLVVGAAPIIAVIVVNHLYSRKKAPLQPRMKSAHQQMGGRCEPASKMRSTGYRGSIYGGVVGH